MRSRLRIYGIYLPIYLLLLIATSVLGSVACTSYLLEDGYFSDYLLYTITNWIVVGATVFFLSYIFTARKDMRFIPSFSSPLNYGPCAIVSAALAFVAVHLISESGILKESFNGLTLAVGILALVSIIYFAVSAISVKRRSIRRSDFGIIVLIFLCCYVAFIFFDTSSALNSPIKTVTLMAVLAILVFFLYETRISLGREMWRQYIAFGFIASLLSAYASIPALIMYFVKGRIIGISIYETILLFSFFVFSTFKLFLVGELVPANSSKVVDSLIASAKERIAELTPDEEVPESDEEIHQISFEELGITEDEGDTLPQSTESVGDESFEASEAMESADAKETAEDTEAEYDAIEESSREQNETLSDDKKDGDQE